MVKKKDRLLIRLVQENKFNGQRFVTIPKKEDLVEGDYVSLKKVKEK